MDYIYKNIQEYNPNKKRKILTFFDDVITDLLSNKKLNLIVTEFLLKVENETFLQRKISYTILF